MDEKQLLDAIRAVVREETATQTKTIEKRMTDVETSLDGLQTGQAKLETGFDEIQAGQTRLEAGFAGLQANQAKLETGFSELQAGQTRLEVSYENQTQKILNLLREDYGRLANSAAKTADYDEVKQTVAEHHGALENHNQRLTELEKKAAI